MKVKLFVVIYIQCLLNSLVLQINQETIHANFGSSHQSCSMEKGVLKNFTKFSGKQLCQNFFFNKVAGLTLATLLRKRL